MSPSTTLTTLPTTAATGASTLLGLQPTSAKSIVTIRNIIFKNFCLLNDEEIVLVHSMRNSEKIRTKMYNQDIIPLEVHKKWVSSLFLRKDCLYFLAYYDNKAIGVVDFTSINSDSCEWGFYLNPKYLNSGYGFLLEYYVLQFAFYFLQVNKLIGAVMAGNDMVYDGHIKYFSFSPDEDYTIKKEIDGENKIFRGLSLKRENWEQWDKKKLLFLLKIFKVSQFIIQFENQKTYEMISDKGTIKFDFTGQN